MDDVPGPPTAPCFNQSKATENFSRLCQLIMTICSDLFRDLLSHYIKPADLRSELDNNRKKLKRILNAQQKEQIYPSSGTTTLISKDLDISVLYILLRNICKLPKHRKGWGKPPVDGDIGLAACVERIRIQRNLLSGHSSSGEIEDTAFQDHWEKLKCSIVEIERQLIGGDMYERGVDELLSCELNPTRTEKYVREFKSIQESMESLESAPKTTKRHLENKKARLDDLKEKQSSTTSQIKGQIESPFLDDPQFTADIDTEYDRLYKVSCVSGDQVWTRGDNKIMKLLNLQGKLLSSIKVDSGNVPRDIAVTREGDLVYTSSNDSTITLVKNKRRRTVITLQGWVPRGVCSTAANDLLVTMMKRDGEQFKVVRYSGLTETQTIQYDDQGRPLYSSDDLYRYISENKNLDICVADRSARAVVVVNQSGKFRFRYTGHPSNTGESFDPQGIATDSQSHILIADCDNNRIHILDQDGQFLRYIHNLRTPWGLCVDSRDNLFVAEEVTAKVKRIQYLESQC